MTLIQRNPDFVMSQALWWRVVLMTLDHSITEQEMQQAARERIGSGEEKVIYHKDKMSVSVE